MEELAIPRSQFNSGIHDVRFYFFSVKIMILNIMIFSQMYTFVVEMFEGDGEIRAPRNNGNEFWVMERVCVRSKPNSQVGEWSPPLFLLHSLPADGALPGGTKKHHLFKKKMCKGNPLVQTPAELQLKLDGLKKTVDKISHFSGLRKKTADHSDRMLGTWDVEDTDWWNAFFAARISMPKDQHGVVGAPPDAVMLHRIKNLLWGTGHVDIVRTVSVIPAAPVVIDPIRDAAFQALALLVQPVTTAADVSSWGRKRAVGYTIVQPGESASDAQTRAVATENVRKNKVLEDYFESLQSSRGIDENAFIDTLEVCLFVSWKIKKLIEL